MHRSILISGLLLLLTACGSTGTSADPSGGAVKVSVSGQGIDGVDPGTVVAEVGGETITMGELDKEAGAQFAKIRADIYRAREGALNALVETRILEAEAKKRGVTVEQLLKTEVDDKVGEVTEADAKEFFDSRPMGNRQFEDFKDRIIDHLKQTKGAERRTEYIASLKESANVKIKLEPHRVNVELAEGDYPSKGKDDAPIQLIEFSDFQCPYCSRGAETVDQVADTYGDTVKIIFVDFPLPIHPEAFKGHEAAACAKDQGKFWEMHDHLFANPRPMTPDDLKKHAETLGLDTAKFNACLDGDAKKGWVDSNLELGRAAGVSGTPGFFVNGIFINGAQPFEAFEKIIDEELVRKDIDPKSVKKSG